MDEDACEMTCEEKLVLYADIICDKIDMNLKPVKAIYDTFPKAAARLRKALYSVQKLRHPEIAEKICASDADSGMALAKSVRSFGKSLFAAVMLAKICLHKRKLQSGRLRQKVDELVNKIPTFPKRLSPPEKDEDKD